MTATAVQAAYQTALAGREREVSPAAADPEEARQIARARTGDPAALSWLLARYRPRIIRLASGMLRGRPDEAEDAAQDAFIRAFRGLSRYRSDAPFSVWLSRIAVRVCLDRRQTAHGRSEVVLSDSAADFLPAKGENPDAVLLLNALLDELTPALRAALILREIDGLSYEETAAVLGIPVGTVRSRLNAARARFRELWRKTQEETEHV